MDLGRQWNTRLKIWFDELSKYYYIPLEEIQMEGFFTMEQMTLEEAKQHTFTFMPANTKWGKKWEYGWFHGHITLPAAAVGKRIVLNLQVGSEMLVFVNGVEYGSIDKQHKYITITQSAEQAEEYELFAECYAGHGPRLENGGPYPMEVTPVPEAPETQIVIGASTFGIWNEEFYQAAMDYTALYQLLQVLPDKSLRAMKVAKGLKEFTYTADFELPEPERTESFVKARKLLAPLLACKNGSTAPTFTIFGQSHLDLAWLWPFEETKRKCARTYSNQLKLMEEYKDYEFLLCEPPILIFLKDYYPALYERVKDKVKEGRMIPEGGLYVECDTNLPSGESLIRQFLYGREWFKKELNTDTRLAWMPDTFGFSAALPQIMKGCGIEYFATQKLVRCDPECDQFPYNNFWWEGMDGTKILSHSYKKNNAVFTPKALVERWEDDRIQQEDIDGMLFPFGYGDGGGGPTRDMLEMVKRCEDLESAPRCVMESPTAFFDRLAKNEVANTYAGELYLSWHRGTYTAQSKTKRGLRKAEIALREAEYWISMRMLAVREDKSEYREALRKLWDRLLLNEFHDILPGTSITRVHKEAEQEFTSIIKESRELLNQVLSEYGNLTKDSITIYNSLSWDRTYQGVTVPACGYVTVNHADLSVRDTRNIPCEHMRIDGKSGYLVENQFLTIIIDSLGQLTHVIDKTDGYEYVSSPCNHLCMYKDVNVDYDAWELGRMYEHAGVELSDAAECAVLSQDPQAVVIQVKRKLNHSMMTQEITIHKDSRRIDFHTILDWKERHKLLKVEFPVNIYTKESIEEIQFGYVKRPTHRNRQFDKDQYEVCNHRYTVLAEDSHGVAVFNDCKYGVSTEDNRIALSLMRAPVIPDMYADQGIQEFTYSMYPYKGSFAQSDVVRQAYELNMPLTLGSGRGSGKAFALSEDNIIIETIKPAQEEKHAIVLRLYESKGRYTKTELTLPAQAAELYAANMLEVKSMQYAIVDNSIELEFRPFEIKTIVMNV